METLVGTEKEMLKGECNAVGKILQVKVSGIFFKSCSWTSLGDIYLSSF